MWRDEPPAREQRSQIVHTDSEKDRSPWTYDETSGAYYLHHFYDFEPDLNVQNPAVQREIEKIISFWLQLGASGFRIDAAPYIGSQDASHRDRDETHRILREMRDVTSALRGDSVLIGEVDAEPDRLDRYFGDGHELQMLFNFVSNNYLFLALAERSAEPLRRAFEQLPSVPWSCQWVHWVRNYDELDLERLSGKSARRFSNSSLPTPTCVSMDGDSTTASSDGLRR
ncbi:MAG: alpha-amylase family glycosyl hydrolase [Thermomicrobiales bacterium]